MISLSPEPMLYGATFCGNGVLSHDETRNQNWLRSTRRAGETRFGSAPTFWWPAAGLVASIVIALRGVEKSQVAMRRFAAPRSVTEA